MLNADFKPNMIPRKQQISREQQISRDLAKFVKDRIGKGPDRMEVKLFSDCVVCLSCGFLTKAEELLVKSGYTTEVQLYRENFINQCLDEIKELFSRILKRKVKNVFISFKPEENMVCTTVILD